MNNKEKETPKPIKANYPKKPDSSEKVSVNSADEQDTSSAQSPGTANYLKDRPRDNTQRNINGISSDKKDSRYIQEK